MYNSGRTPINLGDLAEIVHGYLPDVHIPFDNPGGRELSEDYLVDNSLLMTRLSYPTSPCSNGYWESSTRCAATRDCFWFRSDGRISTLRANTAVSLFEGQELAGSGLWFTFQFVCAPDGHSSS